jgi:hypothetical protein
MSFSDRRQLKRLRVDRALRVKVQLFPVMPFIGESIEAGLINLSEGGLGLVILSSERHAQIKKGEKYKIHFRLPGQPMRECAGTVQRLSQLNDARHFVGIKFSKIPQNLKKLFALMVEENDQCDYRIRESRPFCDPACSYRSLCRKPIRALEHGATEHAHFEIALQHAD